MPSYAPGQTFLVKGLEPRFNPAWRVATHAKKLAYLRVVRELVLIEYDKQLEAGVDKDGAPLTPISRKTLLNRKSYTGHADPLAPPLTPAHQLSRTRLLVDARVEGFAVRVFWKYDPFIGRGWGVVMHGHKVGYGALPVRDVFGLSPLSRATVLRKAFGWWEQFSRGMVVRSPRKGKPGPQKIAVVPPYQPKTPLGGQIKSPGRVSQLEIEGQIYTMSAGGAQAIKRAIAEGRFRGFH